VNQGFVPSDQENDANGATQSVVWVDGWVQERTSFVLEAVHGSGNSWTRNRVPLAQARDVLVCDLNAQAFGRLRTGSRRLEEVQLGRLQKLVSPGDIFPRQLAVLRPTRHDVFVWEGEAGRLYLPALLLIRLLWLWSPQMAQAVLQPSSVDALIAPATAAGDMRVASRLVSPDRPAGVLRRIAWLAQANDARRSWGSVLASARAGRLSLSLPEATLSAWAWGVEFASGFLCCELKTVQLGFRLPNPTGVMRIGRSNLPIQIPGEPSVPHGLVSF
jgi:hypothetical protein